MVCNRCEKSSLCCDKLVISRKEESRKTSRKIPDFLCNTWVTQKILSAEKVHDNVHKITQTLFMKPSEFIQRKQTLFESISKKTSHYSASTKSHANIYLKNKKLRKGWRCWNIISIQRYMRDKFLKNFISLLQQRPSIGITRDLLFQLLSFFAWKNYAYCYKKAI